MSQVPGTIEESIGQHVLSPTERKLAEYKCTQLRFPKCEGRIIVTNERLIFYGHGNDSRIVNEVQINTITGLKCFYGRKPNVLYIAFLVIIFVLFLLYVLATGVINRKPFREHILPIGVLAGGLYGLYKTNPNFFSTKVFFLEIYAQAIAPAIRIGEGQVSGFYGGKALYSIMGRPSTDTDQMMRELGAWIKAVQKGLFNNPEEQDA